MELFWKMFLECDISSREEDFWEWLQKLGWEFRAIDTLEQDAAKIERIKEKYQKIANNTVVVEGNTIKISVPLTKKLEQKVKKADPVILK